MVSQREHMLSYLTSGLVSRASVLKANNVAFLCASQEGVSSKGLHNKRQVEPDMCT